MLEFATLWEMGKLGLDGYRWARKNLDRSAASVLPRVESFINRAGLRIQLHGLLSNTPRVASLGPYQASPAVEAIASESRAGLGALNEPHALVERWIDDHVAELRVHTTDFATVQACRTLVASGEAQPPPVLSACALLVCPGKRCIVVHRRSEHSATFADRLHLLGGAYRPPVARDRFDSPGDRMSLEFTMLREVFEECGLIVRKLEEPVCVARELDTGFIQYVFLGVRITTDDADRLSANSEGNAILIPFDQLPRKLADSEGWVPSGRAQILTWLGLGAPGAGRWAKFDGDNARKAFDRIVPAN